MPDPAPSIIHYREPGQHTTSCSLSYGVVRTDTDPGQVTCFICRKQPEFAAAQLRGVGGSTPPVKLSGVMARSEEIAGLGREARRRARQTMDYTTQDEPRYRHECSDCEYLGHTNNTHSDGTIKRVELYYCHADDLGDVVARHSDGFGDWVRGYTRSTWDPDLALAVVRSIGKGLLRANALGQFNH